MKKLPLITGILLLFLVWPKDSFCAPTKARYISIAPSTTEILFALGLDEEIVGVSSYCNYPPQTKTKEKIGDFSMPNMEKIVSLKPDYIFCTGLEQAPIITELTRQNLKVYVADPANIDELMKTINDIGRITNRIKEADGLIKKMRDDIGEVSSKVKLIPKEKRVRVFIEIWHEPLMTAAKGSFIDELITLAGGINIAHDITRPYSNFSAEMVVSLNPECIIMAYMDKGSPASLMKARFGWSGIEAVKNGQVFNDIDPDIILRPGPRITQGLKEIYRRLYH